MKLEQRNCKHDDCNKEFATLKNGTLYCSPECKKAYTAKRKRADYYARKAHADRIHRRVMKAQIIYDLEGGISWVRELGRGE